MKTSLNAKGYALISVIMFTVMLETFMGVTMVRIIQERRIMDFNRIKLQSFYLAQAGLERSVAALSTATANFDTTYTNQFNNGVPVTTPYDNDGNGTNETAVTMRRQMCGPWVVCPPLSITENSIAKTTTLYTVEAVTTPSTDSMLPNGLNNVAGGHTKQIIELKTSTLFQYGVFYTGDLEFLPGPNATLQGQIHTNGNIYLGVGSGNTLKVDTEYLRAVGGLYHRRKDDSSVPGGTVNIKVYGSGSPGTYRSLGSTDHDNPGWGTYATSRWNGTVQDSAHGVEVITPPSLPPITPGGYYDTTAQAGGVKITKSGGTTTLKCDNGSSYTSSLSTKGITNKSFFDARENKTVEVVEIDMTQLVNANCLRATGGNGVIYATRSDTTDTQPNGFRIINGATLSRDLTFVTDDPLYVQGNFNNTGTRRSVALVSDSLNILSNSWNDNKSSYALNQRVASETTVNAAFATGIVSTIAGTQASPGKYSGGLENYPRFLETWSGKKLNITGAFINLWQSQYAKSPWVYGDASTYGDGQSRPPGYKGTYEAPDRVWVYDTNLPANPPPFTPRVVEVTINSWWQDTKDGLQL